MKSIRTRIFVFLLLPSFVMILLLGAFDIRALSTQSDQHVKSAEQQLLTGYDNSIKAEVKTAVSLVKYFYDLSNITEKRFCVAKDFS